MKPKTNKVVIKNNSVSVKSVGSVQKLLKKRMKEVGAVRDRLRADISELEGLAETCDRAEQDLQSAVDALSELT